jgi:predicted nucleic acid-binding protein
LDICQPAPQRDFHIPPKQLEEITDVLLSFLKLCQPVTRIDHITVDPDDNRVLECAVESKSDYIASWDPHLTSLKQYSGIKIVNPGKLVEELDKERAIR